MQNKVVSLLNFFKPDLKLNFELGQFSQATLGSALQIWAENVAHISTFLSVNTCLGVCFTSQNLFQMNTRWLHRSYLLCTNAHNSVLKVHIRCCKAVKINANELRALKKDSYQNSNLWTWNSNVEGLLIFKIRIEKIK